MPRPRRRLRRIPTDAGLTITSLMDMMTIILVFLLTNFGTNVLPVQPSDTFQLPVSTATGEIRLSASIIVTQTDVYVDGERVLALGASEEAGVGVGIPEVEKQDGMVPAVYDRLVAQVAALRDAPPAGDPADGPDGEPAFRGEVLLQLDRRIPFAVVRDLMLTAGNAGFGSFRFVVVSDPAR